MTLRFRVALLISTIFFVLAFSLYLVFNGTLMKGFLKLEHEGAVRNALRAQEGIDTLSAEIALKAEEWGTWDDSYAFIEDSNAEYEESNLSFEALDQLHVRHFLLVTTDAKFVKALALDSDKSELVTVEEEALEEFKKLAKLALSQEGKVGGLISVGGVTYLSGAAPVTNSAGDAPTRGAIIFTRDFNDEALTKLQQLARVNIRIDSLVNLKNDPVLGQAFLETLNKRQNKSYPTATAIHGLGIVRDVFGVPIHGLATTQERDLLQRGIAARDVVTTYVSVFTVVALLAALLFINSIVVSPLRLIGEQTKQIGESQSEDLRVEVGGGKEIRVLGEEINRMLDQLAESKRQVDDARLLAERANTAKSMFIARVSHELRTPVGGIVGINRIIKKEPTLPRSVRELIEMGDLTAHGLLSIIDEILDFAKAESGELSFERIPFTIREVVRQTLQTVSARLEGKYQPEDSDRVELYCEIDPKLPELVVGDPTKLKQVLTNLLGNAVKFTQHGSVGLIISTHDSGDGITVNFAVRDTGMGIPADRLGAIFEPFKQADSATTRKFQGTGLGLSIVKQFVEGQGGQVGVSSELGKGAEFTVQLPFTTPAQGTNVPQWATRPTFPLLLAAETTAMSSMQASLSRLLGQPVVRIDTGGTHLGAEVRAQIEVADLVVVSEEMCASAEVFELVTSLSRSEKSCVVALLRPSSLALRERLYSHGVMHVLTKPVLAEDVLTKFDGPQMAMVAGECDQTDRLKLDRRLRILIVDDLLTNRIFLEDMLEDAGHDVTSATDGTEMVERLTNMIEGKPGADHYDIVLTDISMAIMNGDDATRAVRELERINFNKVHIPIVALTAHAFVDEQEKIRDAGVDAVLTKPIRPETMAAEFERLLTKERQ